MPNTFYAPYLFDGEHILESRIIEVETSMITGVREGQADQAEHQFAGLVCPGFIDVQVNGGGGVQLNNHPNAETVSTMAKAHSQFGTSAMLPTLITDDLETMKLAADAVSQAIKNNVGQILGIHFEGPHLSIPKKGIHPDHQIRALSEEEMALFLRNDIGQVLVTLAPENATPEQISKLASRGVKICLGHSNASAEQTQEALNAGATGFTHLFNAMSPLSSREPGMVGAALLDKQSAAGLIVDFHHVHPDSCKLAINCKGPDKIMLVTDAMSHVGSDLDSESFAGMEIFREGDKLTIEGGRLAGSALDMATAVRNVHQKLGFSLETAINMASLSPARFLGVDDKFGRIVKGYRADFVELDENQQVKQCWVAGKPAFQA